MIKSLEILYKENRAGKIMPKQWQQVIKKSVVTKGNSEELSQNQRGLFLVNIVSKIYEKIKKQNETIHNKSKQQVKTRDQQ